MARKKLPHLEEAYEIIFKSTLERNPGHSKQFCTIPLRNQLIGFFSISCLSPSVSIPQLPRDFISALGSSGYKWRTNDFPMEGSNILGEKAELKIFKQLLHSLLVWQLVCWREEQEVPDQRVGCVLKAAE